jgi:hypothetical protein
MGALDHPTLDVHPWTGLGWTAADKPLAIVDGRLYRLREVDSRVCGEAAYVRAINDKFLASLVDRLDVEYLNFYECRAGDLSPLQRVPRLRHLRMHWNTKLTDLAAIGLLTRLRTLILVDTPKVRDLGPLTALRELTALEYSGGIWNRQTAMSLTPLASLPRLEELTLTNIKVMRDGLRPLAACHALRVLELSNQFETEEYAFLSVRLPDVECAEFAPWVRVADAEGPDTMIIGRRKPMLHSHADADRIARYEAEFRRLQDHFRS